MIKLELIGGDFAYVAPAQVVLVEEQFTDANPAPPGAAANWLSSVILTTGARLFLVMPAEQVAALVMWGMKP